MMFQRSDDRFLAEIRSRLYVSVVSDVLDTEFALKYGLLIKERRWMRRAIFIVDREGILRYVAYMPKLGIEPDYDEVIAAAKALL